MNIISDMNDYYLAQQLVIEFFDYNEKKNKLWWNLDNPFFGGYSPNTFIELGRAHKVTQFIFAQILEETPYV